MKRVLCISDVGGVSEFYRAVTPYQLLAEHGLIDLTLDHGLNPAINNAVGDYDAVVFSRTDSAAHHVILLNARAAGVRVVFDIDDNLFLLPPSIPVYRAWFDHTDGGMNARLWYLKQNIKLADMLTVSSDRLGEQLCNGEPASFRARGDWRLLPNQILASEWQETPAAEKPDGEVWIGWWGIYNHWDDWRDIAPYIEPAIAARPNVRLIVLGFPGVTHLFPRLRANGQLIIGPFKAPDDLDDYRGVLRSLDIALAPTSACAFNESKSDLKVLQYGAAGCPVIASAVTYAAWHQECWIAKQPGEWGGLVAYALDHPEERAARAAALQRKVLDERTYERNAERWLTIFE